jgi:ABC-type nitrate/sulfonate/bicarbonate transport system substrate-binding protein
MALSEPPARSLRPSRRDFLRLGGLGAAGLALAACGGGSSGGTSPAAVPSAGASAAPGAFGEISMQLSWIKNIEFGGEYMADSKGYYTQAGFSKVDLVTGPVDSADALVVAGNVTVGVSAPDATARFITEQGAPLKIIGATFQKNPFCILSIEEGRPIRTLADLTGKTVGIQAGTNQQIFAGFLKANGIDPASVNQVVVQYEPTPLTEKNVDGFMAFLTNEPFLVKSQGFTPVTLAFADNGLPLASETLCVLQETIDNDRDKLKAFLKAEVQGWNDAVADPAAAAKLAVENYGKDLKLDLAGQTEQAQAQNALVTSDETKTNGLFTISDAAVAANLKSLASIGITVTAEELFDLSLIREVHAENPNLKTAAG